MIVLILTYPHTVTKGRKENRALTMILYIYIAQWNCRVLSSRSYAVCTLLVRVTRNRLFVTRSTKEYTLIRWSPGACSPQKWLTSPQKAKRCDQKEGESTCYPSDSPFSLNQQLLHNTPPERLTPQAPQAVNVDFLHEHPTSCSFWHHL